MRGRIFSRSFTQAILDSSREIRSLSDLHCRSLLGFEPPATPPLQLQLPEVRAPSQYLIDMGLQPTLSRQLSKTYMDCVARYRTTYELYFNRAIRGGCNLPTECYREFFVVLFKRTIQAWDSQIVSIVRVRLCQAGAPQATVHPERVDIRLDDADKAEIMARLGLKATYLTSDRMVSSPSADVTSRLEEVSEQTHVSSTDTVDSRLRLSPISSTEVPLRPVNPFCQPAPPTCFPAPYPPPPEHPLSRSPDRALATSFVSPAPPRIVRSLTSYGPDVSFLTDLFDRMTVTTLKVDSTNPKHHRVFGTSEFDKIKPVPSSITANCSKEPQLASIESIASPPKSTTTVRRRKIAALPTRRGKISASPSPPVLDSVGATPYAIPRPYEWITKETLPGHIPASPQKTRLISTLPSPYTAEAPCFGTPKSSAPRERKVHTPRKTLPQSQTIPQNQASKPLVTAGETSYNVSRSPPLVSDAISYFDSPPTSSDELDTPPSTPPSSHVLLASTSTESLAISSEFDRIVSHKEPLGSAKLPYPRQRYRRLDFTKGGLGRDEQPLTFTFSV